MPIKKLKRAIKGFKVVDVIGVDFALVKALVKLRIPKGAKVFVPTPKESARVSWRGVKCRASEAFVLGVHLVRENTKGLRPYRWDKGAVVAKQVPNGTPTRSRFRSGCNIQYTAGENVYPNDFDPCSIQCSNGIHFFRTLDEALQY